jgi:hypothetical protein
VKRLLVIACLALAVCAPAAPAATPWQAIGVPGGLWNVTFAPGAGASRIYARTQDNWWRSDDDGATWVKGGQIDQGSGPWCTPHVSPADTAAVYSGCDTFSSDAGVHWQAFPSFRGTLQIDAGGTVYAYDQAGIGTIVTRCNPSGAVCTTAVAPGQDTIVVDPASQGFLVRQATDGVAASADAGATWASPHALPAHLLTAQLMFDGRVPHKLVLTGRRDDNDLPVFAVSLDAGVTWSPLRTMPFLPDLVDGAGGSGAQRRFWIQSGNQAAWTADDGVTFHAIHFIGSPLTVDPDDGAHLFAAGGYVLLESRDGGTSWSLRNSPQFGVLTDTVGALTGSGSTLFSSIGGVGWVSHDAGVTWELIAALEDWRISKFVASRDDPAVAYALGNNATTGALWQTLDGGRTWMQRNLPPNASLGISWVESGHPGWLDSGGYGNDTQTTRDGGLTWSLVPPTALCRFGADVFKPMSQAGCGTFAVDPLRAPWDQSFGASQDVLIDRTGAGAMYSIAPLGRVGADWSFTSACYGQPFVLYCLGPEQSGKDIGDAWAAGGHVTYAVSYDGMWAKRDDSRWFLLKPPTGSAGYQGGAGGVAATGVLLLSHTLLAANGLLIPLQAPEVGVPALSLVSGPLHCSTKLSADEADMGYRWLRDGAAIAGSTTADHTIVAADEGHALSCVVTATNVWGTATGTSGVFHVSVTGAAGARHRLALTGTAAVGSLLRCGASKGIGWLRGARILKGRHARTYRVAALDEGHALACQSRAAGGVLTRSAALRVPRPHGGRALPVAATP